MTCPKGCCVIKTKNYVEQKNKQYNRRVERSGALIYDRDEDRILLVQSNGLFWGPPKGGVEPEESVLNGAIREIKEETGLTLDPELFLCSVKYGNSNIFYVEMKSCPVDIPTEYEDNDASGITWIKLSCLRECVQSKIMMLNSYAKISLKLFLNVRTN